MLTAELIENWNNNFPNGKIQENDLKHPTELFVVRTLVVFLEAFGYKVEPPFSLGVESDNTREKRLFLIRLTKMIDRLLKYTDKSYECVYLDIIKPAPKRTALMLEVLLNYHYYYAMFVSDVLKIENDAFQQRRHLIRNIDQMRCKNADRNELALQMEDEMRKLNIALPNTAKEIENYNVKVKQRQEEIARTKTKVEQLQQKLSNLQERELFLKSQVVDCEEVSTFKNEIIELQKNIAELDLQERSTQIDLNHYRDESIKMEKILKCVAEIELLMPAEQLQEYEDVMKKLKKSGTEHANITHEIETLKSTITKLIKDATDITEQYKSKKLNLEQETRDRLAVISENQIRFNKEKTLENDLRRKLQSVEDSVKEQAEMYEYLLHSIDSLMADYN